MLNYSFHSVQLDSLLLWLIAHCVYRNSSSTNKKKKPPPILIRTFFIPVLNPSGTLVPTNSFSSHREIWVAARYLSAHLLRFKVTNDTMKPFEEKEVKKVENRRHSQGGTTNRATFYGCRSNNDIPLNMRAMLCATRVGIQGKEIKITIGGMPSRTLARFP
ncbi:hypothetical protein BD289DRAFT_187392 [Coniella lustricola]|uniref:Uncharacterized protein n=1 Tax=Coniella lustricola TaxID=2025994 RepID=A0A2T3AD52_9PEZI|nr:hypothetical protein BD289DRAFT_187392 [Coniella lustricola]